MDLCFIKNIDYRVPVFFIRQLCDCMSTVREVVNFYYTLYPYNYLKFIYIMS